jgi:PEP-CTERM motif
LIATLSRLASAGKLVTETADDFVTTTPMSITGATFTGLLPAGTPLSAVSQVEIELYHVFPIDSASPDGRVVTRANSPSDNNFDARDSAIPGQLSFNVTLLSPTFTAANSVVNGINPIPGQFTGGEGPVTGEEVQFNITFTKPFMVGADHIFFRPEVLLTTGDFLWLSAPRPIVPPGTPFAADLQSWIRNDGAGTISPNWERIGTDVIHQGPFNAAFSLSGDPVPEPGTITLFAVGTILLLGFRRR